MAEENKTSTEGTQEEKKLPAKIQDILKSIEELSVLELNNLVKALEEKFGVSAMPQMVGVATGGSTTATETGGANKDTVSVVLKDGGQSKIQVIKLITEITGLGLKESKDIVDGVPKVIKENIPLKEAEEIKQKLEGAGATVELK